MYLPEPLNEDGEIDKYRETLNPVRKLLPRRMTPEVSYHCARSDAKTSYHSAAQSITEQAAMTQPSHMRGRRQTIATGECIEGKQYETGWFAGKK